MVRHGASQGGQECVIDPATRRTFGRKVEGVECLPRSKLCTLGTRAETFMFDSTSADELKRRHITMVAFLEGHTGQNTRSDQVCVNVAPVAV